MSRWPQRHRDADVQSPDLRAPRPQTPKEGATSRHRYRPGRPGLRTSRTGPDRLWVTDTTEHPIRERVLYCCVVLDTFSRRVVGWSIDHRQDTALVTNALGMAITNRNLDAAREVVIHSDHGKFRSTVRELAVKPENSASHGRLRRSNLIPVRLCGGPPTPAGDRLRRRIGAGRCGSAWDYRATTQYSLRLRTQRKRSRRRPSQPPTLEHYGVVKIRGLLEGVRTTSARARPVLRSSLTRMPPTGRNCSVCLTLSKSFTIGYRSCCTHMPFGSWRQEST